MVRGSRRKEVERTQATKYLRVAQALRRSAVDLAELGDEGYGNAIGIVAVHAAIAYADALSIAFGGFKSTAGDHERAVDTLKDALGHRADAAPIRTLLGLVRKKDSVSYQGTYYTMDDARGLIEKLNGFAEWAEGMYEQRV